MKAQMRLRGRVVERSLRLWSGVILFVFLTMHLLNHALAVFGLAVLEEVQHWRLAIWQSIPGTILLYGAIVVHIVFTLKRMFRRQTWRMPWDEGIQVVLGLAIPLLLTAHIIATREMSQFYGADESYGTVLRLLWMSRPVLQTLLVVVAWTHGVIGLVNTLRVKPWFPPWRTPGLVVAVLIPFLALAGFASGSREAFLLKGPVTPFNDRQEAGYRASKQWADIGLSSVALFLVGLVAAREIRRRRKGIVNIRYTGHGTVRITRGMSVLEGSRTQGIPHPAQCGGRARCSTCRVLITGGLDRLPAAVRPELTMLERISAPGNIRLACQLRPDHDLSVQILLPMLGQTAGGASGGGNRSSGEEKVVTVLVVDMRAFNTLVRKQMPHELVVVLNRYLAELTQTVKGHGGRVQTLATDGMTAVFGLNGERRYGSRESLLTARDMLNVCRTLNIELASVLPIPLRIGIGIHTGKAIVATIVDPTLGQIEVTMGETVTIADRLQTATKTMLADCLISDATLTACGQSLPRAVQKEVLLPGLDKPIVAHAANGNMFEQQPA